MSLIGLALLAQLAAPGTVARPVLEFPVAGLDDSTAYQGYQTRFFRDAAGNTVQIYLDRRQGRVVHLWADAENESIGFSARDARGQPAALKWEGDQATRGAAGGARFLEYRLTSATPAVQLGWFVLGSMRIERDVQAFGVHRAPFDSTPFLLREHQEMLAALAALELSVQRHHLALLGVSGLPQLRARVQPALSLTRRGSSWIARVDQPALDGRDTLRLEFRADAHRVMAERSGRTLVMRDRQGGALSFSVRITTSGAPLTPLTREEIFTPEFLAFLATTRSAVSDTAAMTNVATQRWRWLERQVRGVELLSSRQKLMAGLPTYATYFGRDMMMTALMMRPIWRERVSESVIASVLRKLSPASEVSHEEALGGQAVREAAAEYASVLARRRSARAAGDAAAADSLLARATLVLRELRRVRENYHMIDDEFQLPVLVARWIADSTVSPAHKREFLLDSTDGGGPRLRRLLRELALVSRMSSAYAAEPLPRNLVSFAPRDSGWASTSWRDSNAGYGGGRYAMDVNAIWVPLALESIEQILLELQSLGFSRAVLQQMVPELSPATVFGRYMNDANALRLAVTTWHGAARHFEVRLAPAEVRRHIGERLAAMPAVERDHWRGVLRATGADDDSLSFMALALDAAGRPLGVANTDPATRLMLRANRSSASDSAASERAEVLRDVRLFTRAYPAGLFIEGVGPVVANDAYATAAVWRAFERDPYHGPRVVWGREVNLFLLGVANRVSQSRREAGASSGSGNSADRDAFVRELLAAIQKVRHAVESSGFRSELWSYDFAAGRPMPVRYGSGSDVQLWSTTDLVVQYTLARLGR
ncbi:MAG: hypothetical protein ABIZ91_00960 [Gemmatimonadaceae bacterium]